MHGGYNVRDQLDMGARVLMHIYARDDDAARRGHGSHGRYDPGLSVGRLIYVCVCAHA
jgi:hypothetical protein